MPDESEFESFFAAAGHGKILDKLRPAIAYFSSSTIDCTTDDDWEAVWNEAPDNWDLECTLAYGHFDSEANLPTIKYKLLQACHVPKALASLVSRHWFDGTKLKLDFAVNNNLRAPFPTILFQNDLYRCTVQWMHMQELYLINAKVSFHPNALMALHVMEGPATLRDDDIVARAELWNQMLHDFPDPSHVCAYCISRQIAKRHLVELENYVDLHVLDDLLPPLECSNHPTLQLPTEVDSLCKHCPSHRLVKSCLVKRSFTCMATQ